MADWENVLSSKLYEDYSIRSIPLPVFDESEMAICRGYCKENECGCYNTSWACPPGFRMDPRSLYDASETVLLVRRRFDIRKDDPMVADVSREVQHIIRLMCKDLRNNGMECLGFADGKCSYCGECAYPEPCRFPDALVPSVSALGVLLKPYLEKHGETLDFKDEYVTIHALIFIAKEGIALPDPLGATPRERSRRPQAGGSWRSPPRAPGSAWPSRWTCVRTYPFRGL